MMSELYICAASKRCWAGEEAREHRVRSSMLDFVIVHSYRRSKELHAYVEQDWVSHTFVLLNRPPNRTRPTFVASLGI